MGFAIPISDAVPIIEKLISSGSSEQNTEESASKDINNSAQDTAQNTDSVRFPFGI